MTKRELYSYYYDNHSIHKFDVDIAEPRQCMHCNQTGVQEFITGVVTNGHYDKFSSITLFACPLCSSTTIHFSYTWSDDDKFDSTHISTTTLPDYKEGFEGISLELKSQFPDFFEIYYQSDKAETEGLDQIAGMGYRKSLEFLVTDYLLAYPVDGVSEEFIKNPSTSLSNKISKISSERIQKLAKAISFIGNDETNYTRRHPEHDINSIKAFIRVLISEIENEIQFKKAEELINKPKG